MTDRRRQQITALVQAAIERPPSERSAFLAAATGDDEALRREVESLLESEGSSPGLADRLPFPGPAPSSPGAPPMSHEETRQGALDASAPAIGPYRVLSLLGAGGMGEVFRAHDSKLHRDVALKVLPRSFELDPDRLARFRREARVLASLNHPHIGAIYGLEESGGRQALVLELVEGPTLADRIGGGPLPPREALAIAGQIADALQAAHDKGIIHRDLKPANVKVTPAGVVKVLDFGLAKTNAADLPRPDASPAPTVTNQTRIGVVLGTAAYMSPEQARGQPVDARTDVWAFGCVLFEMLTGRRAFAADDGLDSIARILEGEPDWRAVPRGTPPKALALVRQCLQKDAGRRPQRIADVRTAIDQLIAPRSSGRAWLAAGAAAILAVSAGAYLLVTRDRQPAANRADWVQLTNLDSVTQPALSPDGRMLAFIRGPSTFVSPGQLYVKLLPDGEPVALTSDDLLKMSPVFSPDGSRIAYTVNDGSAWDTWEVAALQGTARRWLPNASGLTWVGTGRLVFSEIKRGLHMAIVTSTESRAEARDLYVPPHENGMAHRSYGSPDGRWVLVVEMDENSVWVACRVLPIEGGPSRPVGPPQAQCTNAAWSPDGRWMYFTANAGDGFHIWRQRVPDGPPEQLTSGPTEEEGLAIAADGRSLVTSVGLTQRSVWVRDETGERQISLEGYAYWPLLSADGRQITFRVTRTAATSLSPSELWVADVGSGQTRRLFPGQLVTGYNLSRDDRVVAAVIGADARTHLWLAPLDGREPPRQIPGAEGDSPQFGREGEIVFRAVEGDTGVVYRIAENGQDRQKITESGSAVFGTVSPDGEWFTSVDPEAAGVSVYSTRGRAPIRLFPYSQSSRLRWSFDGRRVYFSIQSGAASGFAVGRTYLLPRAQGSLLPAIPPGGFRTEAEVAALPGVQVLPHGDVGPGPSASVYAFSRVTTTRNLYRIPLP
jgi:Tol biopolymer transport system component